MKQTFLNQSECSRLLLVIGRTMIRNRASWSVLREINFAFSGIQELDALDYTCIVSISIEYLINNLYLRFHLNIEISSVMKARHPFAMKAYVVRQSIIKYLNSIFKLLASYSSFTLLQLSLRSKVNKEVLQVSKACLDECGTLNCINC